MEKTTIDVSTLLKAQAIFERFRQNMVDDRDQAGAIHAFKFCYELALKMMQHVLAIQGIKANAPKDIFRKAALEKIIIDPEIWFEFLHKRNLTSYTYEQENVDPIIAIFDSFSLEFQSLISKIKQL